MSSAENDQKLTQLLIGSRNNQNPGRFRYSQRLTSDSGSMRPLARNTKTPDKPSSTMATRRRTGSAARGGEHQGRNQVSDPDPGGSVQGFGERQVLGQVPGPVGGQRQGMGI